MVFKSNKFIVSKSGMFVRKEYLCDDLFKISILTIIINYENNNKIVSSFYLFESCDVWHGRLNHLNYNIMQRLTNHELLPRIIFEKNHKCEICGELKFTKPYFQIIRRSREPLHLINSDIDDLKFVQTKGRKKYFVIFIDDCIRYCYFYLFKSKYKTLEIFKHYKNKVEN